MPGLLRARNVASFFALAWPITASAFCPSSPHVSLQLPTFSQPVGRKGLCALKAMRVEDRLTEKGIILPEHAPPAANYAPYVVNGRYVYISGQLPMRDGEIQYKGKVTTDLSIQDAYESAKLCGLNIVAQAKAACGGDLNKIKRVIKLVGFVNAPPEFQDHPKVINGASDVMNEVFGEAGLHARSAVGVSSLPFNVATEVEAVMEIEAPGEYYQDPTVDKRGVKLRLEPGMKVEALDRKFKDIITVGTVKEIKDNQVLIGFDGWDSSYDFWCATDDGDFQPPGTCMKANARLSPPNGYRGFFDWGSYLQETDSIPAPPGVFKSAKVFPSFKGDVSVRFELWHRMEAVVVPVPPSPEAMERENRQTNSNKK